MDTKNGESIFADFLFRRARGEQVEIESLCAEHEQLAGELRALHAIWRKTGLGLGGVLGDVDGTVRTSGEGPEDEIWARFLTQLESRGPNHRRYVQQGELARGGMGVIHRVFDTDIRRPLAMKVILEAGEEVAAADSSAVKARCLGRFLEEAQVTGQLDHPGIVPVHELGLNADGQVYFTMKLVEGEDLRSVFDRVANPGDEGWNQTRAVSVLLRACEALAYAHNKGVIHRDLKPGNIMVGSFGEMYVMDWGLARVQGVADRRDLRIREAPPAATIQSHRRDSAGAVIGSPLITMDGDVVGTPAYMPPEQAAGRLDQIGPHSDVYAIGAMLYHLLAGHMPYAPDGSSPHAHTIWRSVRRGPPAPLRELASTAPAELAAISEKAMEREIADRYPTMSDLARDLRAYLEDQVVSAYESGSLAELKKWIKRNKQLAATVAAAAIVIAVLTSWFVVNVKASERTALEQRDRADQNADLARRRAEDAEAEKMKVLRLSDIKTLADLKVRMADLWPAHPDKIVALEDWLRDAQKVTDNLPVHERTLADLRTKGIRPAHPLQTELDSLRNREERPAEQADLELRISALEARIEREQPYEFRVEQDAWWHDTLVSLVSDLEEFTADNRHADTVASVLDRLELARTIGRKSIEDHQQEWDLAITAIGNEQECPLYGGLEIGEQMGLVPVGQDPDSELWEFWHVQSGTRPTRGQDGRFELTEDTGLVLVLIPGGTFWMGAQATDPQGRNYDPQARSHESDGGGHPVKVVLDAYFLSKYELTQGQWERITGENPSLYRPGMSPGNRAVTNLHPVEYVSWHDCFELAKCLGLVLPTEAQWEYGCRAGTSTIFHTGDDPSSLTGFANLADEGSRKFFPEGWTYLAGLSDGFAVHAPVGSFRANRFGLHDMHGNVWEWCLDGYGTYDAPYRAGDGARQVELASVRVTHGGAFDSPSDGARSALRSRGGPDSRDSALSARLARPIR